MWRLVLSFFAISVVGQNQDVYLSNLIGDNVLLAQDYVFPRRNEEFRIGSDDSKPQCYGRYDFVIVGAGSAGAVLATRLSEVRDWNILLLEAGGEETDFSDVPLMFPFTWFSDMNWGYYTIPQNNSCLGMRENRCVYFRGKVIGGCSTINALMYVRGAAQDYDNWANQGHSGWSYQDVLPYFKKSENAMFNDGDEGYHAQGGLWDARHPKPPPETYSNFMRANVELGRKIIDYNGRSTIGAGMIQENVNKRGRRASTGRAFLDTARNRTNLKVVTRALATRIVIGDDKIAKGVEFIHNGRKHVAWVRKEVLLSGGAVNSPQLLMLSGIGPANHLKSLGIKVIEDLPVGYDLQDHLSYPAMNFYTNYTPPLYDLIQIIPQYLQGYGPLSSTNNPGIAFISPSEIGGNGDVPMVEYIFIPPVGAPSIGQRMYNFNDVVAREYLSRIGPNNLKFLIVLLHPKSKGRITLKSTDPLDFPNIDPQYYTDPEGADIENMYKGIQAVMKLMDTEAFRKINATFVEYGNICGQHQKYSKQYWYCALRHFSSTIFHPIRTTQMGSDKGSSVVDSHLKVHGVGNLRVVDAGVMPMTLSGHTNAPTVMIAEKISDEIKSDYGF